MNHIHLNTPRFDDSKSFPIIPLARTLAKEGFSVLPRVAKSSARKYKICKPVSNKNAKAAVRWSFRDHGGGGDAINMADMKRASATVIVPEEQVDYTFKDAVRATSIVKERESEVEYV